MDGLRAPVEVTSVIWGSNPLDISIVAIRSTVPAGILT